MQKKIITNQYDDALEFNVTDHSHFFRSRTLAFCNTLKRYKRLGTFKDDNSKDGPDDFESVPVSETTGE